MEQDGIKIAQYIINNKCALGVASKACFPELSLYSSRKRFELVKTVSKELYDRAKAIQQNAAREDMARKCKIRLDLSPEMPTKEIDPAVTASRSRNAWLRKNIKPGQTITYKISYDNIVQIEVTKTFKNYFYGRIKGYREECYYYQHIVKVVKQQIK